MGYLNHIIVIGIFYIIININLFMLKLYYMEISDN